MPYPNLGLARVRRAFEAMAIAERKAAQLKIAVERSLLRSLKFTPEQMVVYHDRVLGIHQRLDRRLA